MMAKQDGFIQCYASGKSVPKFVRKYMPSKECFKTLTLQPRESGVVKKIEDE